MIPKLNQAIAIVDPITGFPTAAYVQWWNNQVAAVLGAATDLDALAQAPIPQFTQTTPDDVAPLPQVFVTVPDDQAPVPQQFFFSADDVLPMIAGLHDRIAMMQRQIDDLTQGTIA